ncbi:SDR family oxidoreductase [Actinacidiphila glaucinigra]|uniref:SDR family NAD(P)-dependent oxidoreductase n=1 Tax=Actinacidiphila glaucinigra TaxID=235986 RepID=UPI0033E07C49
MHYGVTKSAQLALSRGTAQEVAGTGVTVNCVFPRPTLTKGVESMLSQLYPDLSDEDRERRYVADGRASTSLLKRLTRPQEIASLVTYVASDEASATTGAALSVDGGLVPTIIPLTCAVEVSAMRSAATRTPPKSSGPAASSRMPAPRTRRSSISSPASTETVEALDKSLGG